MRSETDVEYIAELESEIDYLRRALEETEAELAAFKEDHENYRL